MGERYLFKICHFGRMLKEILIRIKILLVGERMMEFSPLDMEE